VRMHTAANSEHLRIRMCEVGDACGHKQDENQQENPASRPCDAASWHEEEHSQNDEREDQTVHSWAPLDRANSSRVTRSAHLISTRAVLGSVTENIAVRGKIIEPPHA